MSGTTLDELLAKMPEIAKAVNAFESPDVQMRAFDVLVGGTTLAEDESPDVSDGDGQATPTPTPKRKKKAAAKPKEAKLTAKRAPARAAKVDKNLDLRPTGVQSWRDFVAEKKPKSQGDLSMCAVYWLAEVAGIDAVTVDMVYTCYRDDGRKQPADFRNHLQVLASKYGRLDTSEMENIKLSAPGSNYVEHDLPPTTT